MKVESNCNTVFTEMSALRTVNTARSYCFCSFYHESGSSILLYKQIEKPFSKPVSLKIPNKALLFQCSPDSAPRRRNPCNGKGVEVNLWLQENQTNYKLTMLPFFNCNCRKLNPVQDCYITAPRNAFKCFNFITSHVSC